MGKVKEQREDAELAAALVKAEQAKVWTQVRSVQLKNQRRRSALDKFEASVDQRESALDSREVELAHRTIWLDDRTSALHQMLVQLQDLGTYDEAAHATKVEQDCS